MLLSWNLYLLFGSAAVVGALTTEFVRNLARQRGSVNHPNPIVRQHTQPVALMGGMAIAASTAAILGATLLLNPGFMPLVVRPVAFLIGASGFLLLGAIDDLRPLTPSHKLFGQSCIAL